MGGTKFNFDPLLGMIRYWRRQCTAIYSRTVNQRGDFFFIRIYVQRKY